MLQHAAHLGAVLEELAAELLGRQRQANALAGVGNRADALPAIERQAPDMEDVAHAKALEAPVGHGHFVEQLVVQPHLHAHHVRVQGQQLDHLAGAVAVDVGEGVAAQVQRNDHHFPELHAAHPLVGLVMDEWVQRVAIHQGARAVGLLAVEVERQHADRFGQHLHAGIDGCALHGRLRGDQYPAGGVAATPGPAQVSLQGAPVGRGGAFAHQPGEVLPKTCHALPYWLLRIESFMRATKVLPVEVENVASTL